MAVWETKRIKHCAKLSPPCDTSKLLPDSEVTFTPMECIKNGYFLNRKAPFSTVNGSYTQYQEGDIVIAKVTPCFENGNIAEMSGLYSGFGFGSSELFVLRPYNIQSRFLFYTLQSEDFKEKGCATMTGTGGLKRVSPAFIANYQIAVPQPDEQKRIAKFLDKKCAEIDAVLEKTRVSIEEYKKLKQAIITQAVTKGVRGDRPMKESGIEWIGEIPADWSVRKLYRAITKIGDIDHFMPESVDDGIPYLMTGDLKDNLSEVNFEQCKQISPEDYVSLSAKIKAQKGDVIFARYATIGTACYVDVDKEFLVSYSCLTIKPLEALLYGKFLFYYVKSSAFFEDVKQYFNSNTQSNVGLDSMSKAKIVLPDFQEQEEIAYYLDSKCKKIDGIIRKKEQALTELESYKESLIYEYVTGKKEVSV